MLGGSSWSRSFEPPGLEDKTGLTTSSAPRRSPWGGSSFGLQHRAWQSAAGGEADVGSAWVLGVLRPRPSPTFGHRVLTSAWPPGLPLACQPAGLFCPGVRPRQPRPVPASRPRRHQSQKAGRGGVCFRPSIPAVGGVVTRPVLGKATPGNILGPWRCGLGLEAKTPGWVRRCPPDT